MSAATNFIPAPDSDRSPTARLVVAASVAIVALVLAWIVSAGWMTRWPTYTTAYGMLADAFLHGQTSLRVRPAAGLLGLPDPYDPNRNAPYRQQDMRLHDMSLYGGRYYMYWGPVPAILELPAVAWAGHPIGDQYLTFAMAMGVVAVSAALLLAARDRLFPESAPPWTVGVGILVAGLAMPIPFLMARAAMYEAAILAGQFFLLGGIYATFTTVQPDGRPAGKARAALAGICWGLAVGSRASLAPAVVALASLAGWRLCRRRRCPSARRGLPINLTRLAFLAVPLIVAATLLGYYNYTRFGSWREFGQRYQLAGYNLRQSSDHLFSLANVPAALYAYLLKPLDWWINFPFVHTISGIRSFPRWVRLPPDYEGREPTAGILWCLPVLGFVVAPVARLIRRAALSSDQADDDATSCTRRSEGMWLTAALLVASLVGSLPVLFLIGSTMRYLADITPALVILAVIGVWRLIAGRPASVARRILGLFVALSAFSIAVGVLLALEGYDRHFHMFHRGYLGL